MNIVMTENETEKVVVGIANRVTGAKIELIVIGITDESEVTAVDPPIEIADDAGHRGVAVVGTAGVDVGIVAVEAIVLVIEEGGGREVGQATGDGESRPEGTADEVNRVPLDQDPRLLEESARATEAISRSLWPLRTRYGMASSGSIALPSSLPAPSRRSSPRLIAQARRQVLDHRRTAEYMLGISPRE